MIRRTSVLLLLVCACGRGRFGLVPDANDAAQGPSDANADRDADTNATADADIPVAACETAWLMGPTVSTPALIASLANPGIDYTPFLAPDGLELYFATDRTGNFEIYSARRPTLTGTFGAPQPVAFTNTAAEESQLTLSRDGLEAFLGTNRPGQRDIYRATRTLATEPFGPFSIVTEIVSTADEYNAVISYDHLRVYFAADTRPGNIGLYDIWSAARPARDQPFAAPALISELDTTADEASPTLIATDRVVVFTSSRAGGSGALDLWYATRANPAGPFGTPQPVPTTNTTASDYTPYLRPDGCELFFASNRAGTNIDIFVSQITP
jgi:hypothetical protein